jgi:putative ABC transport system permease protein
MGIAMPIDSLKVLYSRLTGRLRGPRFESEMDEELQFHIEMETERLLRSGLPPPEARRRALVEFGGLERTREDCRDAVGMRLVDDLFNDLRYAARTLIRSPGFTVVAVLTLALGVGANTAVFSVVNALLLTPLPFDEPGRLVMLWEQNPETGFDLDLVAWGDYLDWQEQCKSIASFGCVVNNTAVSRNFMLRIGDDVTRIRGRHVSSGLFDVLAVRPELGQTFQQVDDQPGGLRRAVLSHALWTQAFSADPQVVGRLIDVGRGEPFEVIGVMPPSFRFPQDADVWLSLAGWIDERTFRQAARRRDYHSLWVVARIKEDATLEEASAELITIQRQIADDPQNRNMVRLASDVVVTPMLDQVNGQQTRPALLLLLGAVAFVLLIACVNVANLLLARAISRRREIAIRVALGAGRLRVIRQLLTESLLLSLLGAAAGVLFALWSIELLELIRADASYLGVKSLRFDRMDSVRIDPAVLGFTLSMSVVTGVLFGLIPAVQASRLDVNEELKEDSRSGTPGRSSRALRNALVILEVALALILMAGACTAVRGFVRMLNVELGMQPENMLRAELDLDMAAQVYGMGSTLAYDEVMSRLSALPGVAAISGCGEIPLVKSGWNDTFKILGSDHDALPLAGLPSTDVRAMGPGAFKTLAIPLVEGRDFTEADDQSAPQVAIINEVLKSRFFPNESPLGRTIQMRGWKGHEKTIVGVVGSVRNYSRHSADQPEIYFPFKQSYLAGSDVGPVIIIRLAGEPESFIPAIRHAVDGADPLQQVLIRFATMEDLLIMSASWERFYTVLLGCFAAVALLLAMIGVYGVMAYSTSQRIREFGIRIALGAQPGQILRSIIGQCSLWCGVGIAIGLGGSLALGQLLQTVFFGLDLLDLSTLAGVSAILFFVAIIACLFPALSAMRIQPLQALRHE